MVGMAPEETMALPALPALAGILAFTVGEIEILRPPSDAPAATPAPRPCSVAEYRQFDFWLGDWDVVEAGKPAGANRITSILGGCAVREEWKGAGGLTGTSLNMWDSAKKRWSQTWVDEKGNVLLLIGGRQGAKMVLEGEKPQGQGTVRNRITWSPADGGHVRQLWETSTDGGKTWETAFDGDYGPRKR
jgi:hypothetical protein